MAVITISREFASGARIFAQKLAERLGYSLLEKELVAQVAEKMNISASDATLFTKERESRLLRFLDKYTSNTVKRVVDRSYGRLDDRSYYDATSKLVSKVAQDGNVIILGWGSQCILQDHPGTLHLRLIRGNKDRVAFVKENHGLDDRGAQELIEREDRDRSGYIERYFNRSWDDAELYHMILNLSRLSMDEALEIVVDWTKRHPTG